MHRHELDRKAMPLLLFALIVGITVVTLHLAGYFFLGWAWTPGPGPAARVRLRVFWHSWLITFCRPPAGSSRTSAAIPSRSAHSKT